MIYDWFKHKLDYFINLYNNKNRIYHKSPIFK